LVIIKTQKVTILVGGWFV